MLGAASVTSTDADTHVVTLAQENLAANAHFYADAKVDVAVLPYKWGTSGEAFDAVMARSKGDGFDVIVGADVLYSQKMLPIVARDCARLGSHQKCNVLLTSPVRREVALEAFSQALEEAGEGDALPRAAGLKRVAPDASDDAKGAKRPRTTEEEGVTERANDEPLNIDAGIDTSEVPVDRPTEVVGVSGGDGVGRSGGGGFRVARPRAPILEVLGVSETTIARWCPQGLVVINGRRGTEMPAINKEAFVGAFVAPVDEGGAHGFGGGAIHRELF
jgi:predicted nicotinamide N-methyase